MITVQKIQMMVSGGRWDKLVCLEHDGVVKFGVLGELLAWKKKCRLCKISKNLSSQGKIK